MMIRQDPPANSQNHCAMAFDEGGKSCFVAACDEPIQKAGIGLLDGFFGALDLVNETNDRA